MPAKRVLISIDERILSRIDDAARRHGLTRSRFLAQAAMAQIEGPSVREARPTGVLRGPHELDGDSSRP